MSPLTRATPARQARDTDAAVGPGGGGRRRPLVWLTVLFVSLAIILSLAVGAAGLLGFHPTKIPLIGVLNTDQKLDPSRTDGSASLAFHRGDPRLLGSFSPNQQKQIADILCAADQEYLKIEQRYAIFQGLKGSNAVVRVRPFKQELKTLEDRVWSQLRLVLVYNDEFAKAQNLLPIRGSLFPFGTEEITIEISRQSGGFRWRLSKAGDPGSGQFFSGSQLPDDYARFWEK